MEFEKKLPPDQVNRSRKNPLRILFSLLIVVLIMIGGAYLVLGFAVDLAAPLVPWSWESKWGDYLASNIADNRRTPEERKLQAILDRLAASQKPSERKFVVHIVDDPMVNAVALPGGHIVVFTGLLKLLDDQKQTAFVLAHELGHYENRDHIRGLGRRLLLQIITSYILSDNKSLASLFIQSADGLESRFSQSQEFGADRYAVKLMRCAFGGAEGAVELLSKLAAREDASQLAYFFATHPHPKDRVEDAKKMASYKSRLNCP